MRFSSRELGFLKKNEVCRLATVSGTAAPHVVPVCFIFHEGFLYIATDYDTRKYKNIIKNPRVALVIDVYRPNRGISIEGEAEILERGEEFKRVFDLFHEKFDWVRKDPWGEGEAPFIKIKPLKKVSWGL